MFIFSALFDSFLTTSPTQKTTSPTTNFFPGFSQFLSPSIDLFLCLDQPFGSTSAVSSSNDANWGAFVEPTKPTTTVSPPSTTTTTINPTVMQSNHFAHPPPEPVRFSVNNTIKHECIQKFRLINMQPCQNCSVLRIQFKIIIIIIIINLQQHHRSLAILQTEEEEVNHRDDFPCVPLSSPCL